MAKRNQKKHSSTGSTKSSRGRDAKNQRTRGKEGQLPDEAGGKTDNDPRTYGKNEMLIRNAASIPFANPAGVPIDFSAEYIFNNALAVQASIPTVFALYMVPSVGFADDANDPINVATRKAFTYTRSGMTSTSPYNGQQEMMFLLGMDQVFSAYAFCGRIYGLISTYAQRNRAIPTALFRAMGLDYDDFSKNIGNFRYWMNVMADKMSSLCVPSRFEYFRRHMWLYENVFFDGPTDKAQMYIYVPAAFLKYNPTGHGSGTAVSSCLDYVTYMDAGINSPADLASSANPHLTTCDELIAFVESLMEPILASTMFNTIAGDILRAFGSGDVLRLLPLVENYSTIPLLNSEVMDQIHNAFAPGVNPLAAVRKTDVIYEDIDTQVGIGYIKSMNDAVGLAAQTGRVNKTFGSRGVLLDFDVMEPDPDRVMVGTRLIAVPNYNLNGNVGLMSGSEIITGFGVFEPNNSFGRYDVYATTSLGVDATKVACFYKHPVFYKLTTTGSGDTQTLSKLGFIGELENSTFVQANDLRKMHETALLGEFDVPLMG